MKLASHSANHPVATLLVEASSLKIKDANRSAVKFFGLTKRKLQSHLLSDFCAKQMGNLNNASGKDHGACLLTIYDRPVTAKLFSYRTAAKSKYVVFEFHPSGLGESNHQLQFILENLPKTVIFQFRISREGDLMDFPYMSPSSQDLFGLSPKEIIEDSSKAFALVHPDDVNVVMESMWHSRANLENHNVTHRIIIDHKIKWISTLSTPTRMSDGSVLWSGVSIDVTQQRLADELVTKSETQLRAALNATNDHVYVVDKDFKIILANAAAQRAAQPLLNRTVNIGDSILDYATVGSKDVFVDRLHRCLAGEVIEAEFEMTTMHGSFWVLINYNPVTDQDKNIVGVSINLEDRTRQKEAENELKSKELQLRTLADNLPKGGLYQRVLNADGTQRSAFFSEGFTKITGVPNQELIRSLDPFASLVSEEDHKLVGRKVGFEVSQAPLVIEYEFPITNRITGKKHWLYSITRSSLMDDGAIAWDGLIIDITDRKEAEQNLETVESNLKAIVENSDTGFVLYDNQFRVVSFNRLAQQFSETYLKKTIVKGTYGLEYFSTERQAILSGYFEKARQGEMSSYTINYGTIENPFWLFGRCFPAQNNSGDVFGVVLALTDITFIKESQSKLDRSEKLYRSLINSQTSFLVRTDMQGYYTFVNKRFLEHFGFVKEEVLGKHSFETIHPEDRGICERAVMDCMVEPGKVVKVVFRKPNNVGDFFWTEWEFVTIQNESGELTDIQCFGYDITEKLGSQRETEKLAQRLVVAKESAGLGVWEYNHVKGEVKWDSRVFEMFGLDEKTEITFREFKKWVHPDDWELVKATILAAGKRAVNFTYRIIRQTDHSIRYLQAFAMHQPATESVIGVNFDVTDRKEIENKLAQTASRLSLATESAKIGVWEWNMSDHTIQWDPIMFELYGLSPDEGASFETFTKTIYHEDQKKTERDMQVVLEKKIPINTFFRIIRQSDRFIRHIKSYGIYLESNNSYTGINLDVTDLIEKENAIVKAKSEIEQLQLRALRAAMNPHFIFNALNSIQSFITQNQRESAIGYLSKFSKLIRGILDGSFNEKSTLASELDLVKHYVEIEQLRFEHKFDFRLTVGDTIDLDVIELPALMIQPFVENAILHGLYAKNGQGMLHINVSKLENSILISITDNGIGRTAAMAIAKAKFPDHKSRGQSLSQERTRLAVGKIPIEIKIIDLLERCEPAGTRVEIVVKFNE
jgi:PAS domain S-box-containing protein